MLPVDAVVVDVLGTLVDEPRGLRAALADAAPDHGPDPLLALWSGHVEHEQGRIVAGERTFAASDVIDAEAAELVAERAGITDRRSVTRLATAGRRLPAWPDSHEGMARLASTHALVGLSNASRTALLHLDAHAGLRWHQALSAESAGTYKPAPEVYRLAVEVIGCPPERLLMVAAHAWDLRGAQAIGMRTAFVSRPVGDAPTPGDTFDLHAPGLVELADMLAEDRR